MSFPQVALGQGIPPVPISPSPGSWRCCVAARFFSYSLSASTQQKTTLTNDRENTEHIVRVPHPARFLRNCSQNRVVVSNYCKERMGKLVEQDCYGMLSIKRGYRKWMLAFWEQLGEFVVLDGCLKWKLTKLKAKYQNSFHPTCERTLNQSTRDA